MSLDISITRQGRQRIGNAGPNAERSHRARWEDAFVDVLGTRMHYVHAGSGRPMLLIHGIVGSTTNWRRNIAALARNASVYAIDLVNMGRSQRVAGIDADLEASADRVAAFMDALGIDQAEIIGHSHGGAVALMLAVRHPERVRSLMLFAPANPFSDLGDPLIRLYSSAPGRLLARIVPYLPRRVQLFALGRMYGDPARIVDGSLDGYIDGMRVPGTMQHVIAIVRGWFTEMATLKAALPQVTSCPHAADLGRPRSRRQPGLRPAARARPAVTPS